MNRSIDVEKIFLEAKKIAKGYGVEINSEHLLAGIMNFPSSNAFMILKNLNFSKEKVPNLTANDITSNQSNTLYYLVNEIEKNALTFAKIEGFEEYDSQHLLLSLISNPSYNSAKILADNGISRNAILFAFSKFQMHFDSNIKKNKKEETDDEKTEFLSQFGIELVKRAKEGKIDPLIGRNTEINRIIQILSRRTKNNPVIIGEPGVGKTAIIEGLALDIAQGNVPDLLKGKDIFSLNVGNLVAGTKYRGDFEERFKKALEAIKSSNTILFIDEIHMILKAGDSEGGASIANMIKPILARGEIPTIGATTLDEYKKHIEKDAALERRFMPVMVDPPSVEDTIKIIEGIKSKYEAHHKVKVTEEAVYAAASLSDRYINDRFLPDKAIDLIDEASSKIRMSKLTAPPKIKQLEEELYNINIKINEAADRQKFDIAYELQQKRRELQEELDFVKIEWDEKKYSEDLSIGFEDIAQIVSEWTKIPLTSISEAETEKLLKLEEELRKRIVGQEEGVISVANAVRRSRAGLKDVKRPIGSFLFLGPTGVGKTELAKSLAEVLFGEENSLIRIDMSEYSEKFVVSRLTGASPGYVGYEEGGQLTEQVRRKPYSVLLFDEIEKAHPDVLNMLLQILDDGILTDGHGRTVSFKNTIIIMTSNIGSASTLNITKLGFGDIISSNEYDIMKDKQLGELKKTLKPEFINRIDEIIVFRKLDKTSLLQIQELLLQKLKDKVAENNIVLNFSKKAKDFILEKGTNEDYGARPLKRTITKLVENRLSEMMISGTLVDCKIVNIDVKDGELTFSTCD